MWSGKSKSGHALYVKKEGKPPVLIITIYVDDLIFTTNNEKLIQVFIKQMIKEFEMSGPGLLSIS